MTSQNNEIGSVKTVFRILEEIKEQESVGVTELAKLLDFPKSTVYSHLNTLTRQGYLRVDDGQYKLGLRFLDYGERARANLDLYDIAQPEVDELAEETSEVVNLMVEENEEAVYLYVALGEKAVQFDTHPGMRLPLYCTALGKVTLAHFSEERRNGYFQTAELNEITEKTVTDPDELREEFEQIREQGYALDYEERAPGIRCVAVPIIVEEQFVGAISITGPAVRMQDERFTTKLPEKLIDTASVVELNMRYS